MLTFGRAGTYVKRGLELEGKSEERVILVFFILSLGEFILIKEYLKRGWQSLKFLAGAG
jgi:hypothetical protein